ncbi:hypothetical protein BOX15_Mlig034104g1 [Macrostomum lignano]|uniref:Uncharacterized protein n=1 Tax=Macrostomum lignano TaxID=282301 RepID=A0A267E1E9_9PLAT|nr:hypothetical protein BOX15_Mlig034104g1 [Macrostomum lignano]
MATLPLVVMTTCLLLATSGWTAATLIELYGPSLRNPHCRCSVTTKITCNQARPDQPCLTKVCVNGNSCSILVGSISDLHHVTSECIKDFNSCRVCVFNNCKTY